MWSAPSFTVLKNGSYATRGCESCQVGNEAALSGLSGVPQGRLFGAGAMVNACKSSFEGEVYGSFRHLEDLFFCAYAENLVYRSRFFFYRKRGYQYVRLPCLVQKVAPG